MDFGSFAESLEAKSMFILPDIDDPTSMTVAHVFYNADDNVVSSGTQKMNVLTPGEFKLYPNYPNPFNPVTFIRYAIREAGLVTVEIYDIKGQFVETLVQSEMEPGFYDVKWDAEHNASGIYFCRMIAGQKTITSKLLLVK